MTPEPRRNEAPETTQPTPSVDARQLACDLHYVIGEAALQPDGRTVQGIVAGLVVLYNRGC